MAAPSSLRALPFRALRFGLRTASRAGGTVVERVLRGSEPPPFEPRGPEAPGQRYDPRPAVPITVGGVAISAPNGATILEVANIAGVDLRSYCGGNCSCGTCRVEIRSGAQQLSKRSSLEELVLGSDAVRRGDRLACQAQVRGPVEVVIPEWF
ncbi:MAG: (2Fe-2S)-binding protein [Myxococcales bacterium]|nr:(2Fe-2S)-binding protein [Myxococcales bacterium]